MGKRAKYVYPAEEVVALFATRAQSEAREQRYRVFFEPWGDDELVLYSYGYHFPIARFVGDDTVLITTDRYSVTTNKHISWAVYHCQGLRRFYVDQVMATIQHVHNRNFDKLCAGYEEQIRRAERARDNAPIHFKGAEWVRRHANEYAAYFNLEREVIPLRTEKLAKKLLRYAV